MSTRLLHGDCRSVLKSLPSESVHCVVTSPPYFGLRDYGTGQWEGGDPDCDHRPKIAPRLARPANGLTGGKSTVDAGTILRDACHCGARRTDSQIGLEATPDAYVAEIVAVFREVRRVMRSDATLWCNLGDSFGPGKQLQGIPWRVAFALQKDGWYLRQDIIWSKPNPMPESVRDRCCKSHEYLFLLSKSRRYHFDQEAIAEPGSGRETFFPATPQIKAPHALGSRNDGNSVNLEPVTTRTKRSVWEVATQSFADAHFATFPPALIEPCILAGCPAKACATCGKPWVREVEREAQCVPARIGGPKTAGIGIHNSPDRPGGFYPAAPKQLGFSPSCSCNAATVPGTCLDPFAGAGTTGLVADRLGRNAILIELNASYADMSKRRIVDDAPLFAEVVAA